MNKADLENAKASTEALAAKIDELLEPGPKILVVQVNGRVVNIRSNQPLVDVELLDLALPEDEDPDAASLRRYPFEIY